MSADVRGGYTVLPHVQAFADAVEAHGWASSFGTYAGHDPTPERALDIFVPVDDPDVAAAICQFGIDNQGHFGVWYEMSRQRIWNAERAGEGWRPQSPYDRGSLTANHYDHVHVSFYETGDATPEEEDFLMAVTREEWDAFVAEVKGELSQIRSDTRDLQAYMSETKGGIVDTIEEAIAGVVNETNKNVKTTLSTVIGIDRRLSADKG